MYERRHLAWVTLPIMGTLTAACSRATGGPATEPPYPPSPVIESVSWDLASLVRKAPGSDLWALAWADDGELYAAWGDGGGFGGTNSDGRVSLGVARLEGPATDFTGHNVWGGKDCEVPATFPGKSNGIVSVGGVLYMAVVEQGNWLRSKIGRSTDHGRSWTFSSDGWDFAEPDGAFSDIAFLTFGRDYQGARAGFVYAYSQDKRASPKQYDIAMFRVPKDQIMNRSAYQYFAGLDDRGKPSWTRDVAKRKPVFTDPNGVGWGVRVSYHPGLRRYLLTAHHDESGGWGLFDAPEPWGPWTTVAYCEKWVDSTFKFGFTFNQKWMSADGRAAYMVFSGTGIYDSFNVVKATFVLRQSTTR